MVEREDGSLVFVEPYETSEDFGDFLEYVRKDSRTGADKPVKYAQTRECPSFMPPGLANLSSENDNLRGEYIALFNDVQEDVAFARIALQHEADAINLWIGNDRSVTALHKDNYENIYVQVRGQKHFVLLPPIEMPCVNEQPLLSARYAPKGKQSVNGPPALVVEAQVEKREPVPVALWDPDGSGERPSEYSHLSKPLRVTVNEGDMLYLPAMVSIS